MIVILVILIVLILAFYVFITYNFDYWFKLGVSCPATCVLFGDLPNEFLRRQHVSSDYKKIYNEFKGKTPYAGFISARWPHLLILEAEVIKDVLIRNFNSFCNTELSDTINKVNDPLHSRSLFGLKGSEWKDKRTEVMPAFTNAYFKNIFEPSQEIINNLISLISDNNDDEPFEAKNLSEKLFLDIMATVIYGVEADELQSIAKEISLKIPFVTFLKILALKAFPFMKDRVKIQISKCEAHQYLIKLTQKGLDKRLEAKSDRRDFLDFLIELKKSKELNAVDLAAHSVPFLCHGWENLSIALSHALYELGKNVRVQDKLRDEIDRHCKKDGQTSFDSLQQMLYLEQVFYESLRLHPPVTSVSRVCSDTIGIELDGKRVVVEEGIVVTVPIMQIQHDASIFMEAKKFHPERFDYTLKSCRDGCTLIPFGGGPRSCLGKNFALNICKISIAMIVKKFKISVHEKTHDNPFVINPNEKSNTKVGGIWLNFKKLDGN